MFPSVSDSRVQLLTDLLIMALASLRPHAAKRRALSVRLTSPVKETVPFGLVGPLPSLIRYFRGGLGEHGVYRWLHG